MRLIHVPDSIRSFYQAEFIDDDFLMRQLMSIRGLPYSENLIVDIHKTHGDDDINNALRLGWLVISQIRRFVDFK